MNKAIKNLPIIIFLVIFLIAIFFRFYNLSEIPPGLYPDVAINGNDALGALESGNFKLYYPENNGREGLFMNLIALSFSVFGASVWAIKLVAAIFGTLTVAGLYFLTNEFFAFLNSETKKRRANQKETQSKKTALPLEAFNLIKNFCVNSQIHKSQIIALLSTFFIAISFWHVNFSRLGFRAIMTPFFLVWSIYFLIKARRVSPIKIRDNVKRPEKIEILNWALAGLLFGFGFHTYIAFRIAPLILIPVFLIEIWRYWPRIKNKSSFLSKIKKAYIKDGWYKWDIFLIAVVLSALPMAVYYLQNPADFIGRSSQVSVFASENPIKQIAQSIALTFGQFIFWGDANWRHNLSGSPQIFFPLIPFFIIGLIFCLRQIFKKQNYKMRRYERLGSSWVLSLWWGAMLLPSIMTQEGLPHALRTIGAIAPSYIFVGLGLYLFFEKIKLKIKNPKNLLIVCLAAIVGLISLVGAEYYRYFIHWGKNQETKGAFTQRFVDEANYLNSLPPNINKYVIVNEPGVPSPYPDGLPMPAQTIIFLSQIHQPKTEITYLKTDQINKLLNLCGCGQSVILPMRQENQIFETMQKKFPNGKIKNIGEFSVFQIN